MAFMGILNIIREDYMRKFYLMFSLVLLSAFLTSGCLQSKEKTVVFTQGWAENHFYTGDGRLFVTGENNVYEVVSPEKAKYERVTLYNAMDGCVPKGIMHMFHGIAEYGGYLFLACNRLSVEGLIPMLFYAKLEDIKADDSGRPIENLFREVRINGLRVVGNARVSYANGIAIDLNGHIFIADSLGESPSIERLTIGDLEDDDASNDFSDLRTLIDGHANGMAIDGDTLYYTHGESGKFMVKRLDLDMVGENAEGNLTVVEQDPLLLTDEYVYDDLSVYETSTGKGLLVAVFNGSSIVAAPFSDMDSEIEIKKGSFANPSSVRQARSVMFESNEITVTELGAYGMSINSGNRLSSFACDSLP
jgi:hypothetical protein